MPVMKQLNVGGVTYDTVGEASVTQVVSTGTKIATVNIDGTSTDLYAPSGGSSVEPATAAPIVDGTAAVGTSAKYAREDHVHPTDTSRAAASHTHAIGDVTNLQSSLDAKQATLVSGTNIKTINGDSILGSGNLTVGGNPTSMTAQEVAAAVESGWADPPTLTVSLTNPVNSGNAYNPACKISVVEDIDEPFINYEIESIASPTGSATVTVPLATEGIYVEFFGTSVDYSGTPACTGGVSWAYNYGNACLFQVTGDGTVTIDGVDYDD